MFMAIAKDIRVVILKLADSVEVTAKNDGRFDITIGVKNIYRKKS